MVDIENDRTSCYKLNNNEVVPGVVHLKKFKLQLHWFVAVVDKVCWSEVAYTLNTMISSQLHGPDVFTMPHWSKKFCNVDLQLYVMLDAYTWTWYSRFKF